MVINDYDREMREELPHYLNMHQSCINIVQNNEMQ